MLNAYIYEFKKKLSVFIFSKIRLGIYKNKSRWIFKRHFLGLRILQIRQLIILIDGLFLVFISNRTQLPFNFNIQFELNGLIID